MAFPRAHPDQKAIYREFATNEMERQRQHLIAKYKLRKYHPQLQFNFRTDGVASWGGGLAGGEPFIQLLALEICAQVGKTGKFAYDEYDHLADKEGIGNEYANWKQYTAWTIAHELAHTLVEVDRFRRKVAKFFPKKVRDDASTHGLLWQHIYRDLRVNACPEELYPVEEIDFSNAVHHVTRQTPKGKQITFFRASSPVAWYIRDDGVIYESDQTFSKKVPTEYRKLPEIRDQILSV